MGKYGIPQQKCSDCVIDRKMKNDKYAAARPCVRRVGRPSFRLFKKFLHPGKKIIKNA